MPGSFFLCNKKCQIFVKNLNFVAGMMHIAFRLGQGTHQILFKFQQTR